MVQPTPTSPSLGATATAPLHIKHLPGGSFPGRRLMILITSLQYGGADSQVVALALGLKNRGWEISVVCMVTPTAFADMLRAADVPVHSLDMPKGVPDPRAIRRLAALVRDFKPDVLHSHMVHANLLARATRLFVHMPVLVCTAHNLREESEKGGATWHKELLYRWTDPLADETTIISHAAFRRYLAVGAVPSHKFSVVPNGIDTDRFAPSLDARARGRRELGFTDEFVWMAVGRMVVQKNYPNLLRAFACIDFPNSRLMIVGKGPLQPELEALSASLGLSGRVRFVGVRPDLADWYNAADAFVNSSAFEGLSAALLEAAATALPAVITHVGGNAEIYPPEIGGYLVPPADSAALAAALRRVTLLGDVERRQLGQAARNHCLQTYSLQAVIAQWEKLYDRLGSCVRQEPCNRTGTLHLLSRNEHVITVDRSPAKRLKVLYVITRAERGGAQVHLSDLIQGLHGRVQAVLAIGESGYLCDEANRIAIRVHRLRRLIRPVRPLTDLRAVFELVSLIRTEKPEVIHAHTSKAGLVSRLAALLTRTPVLFTAHTWSFNEGSSGLQDKISLLLERVLARLGGHIIVVSESNSHIALHHRVATKRQLSTVWNGIPDGGGLRANHGRNPVPRIVMVARFVHQKDHENLLRALADVQVPWSLSLPGDGPLLERIKRLAEQLGIQDRVHFPGACDNIPELLAASDIFVLSTNHEGLPISILEAMRAGLPVVATDVGGISECVDHGVTGYLVQPKTVADLRGRIVELLSCAEQRAQLGKAGRERFLRDFQLEAMVSKTLDIYQSIGTRKLVP